MLGGGGDVFGFLGGLSTDGCDVVDPLGHLLGRRRLIVGGVAYLGDTGVEVSDDVDDVVEIGEGRLDGGDTLVDLAVQLADRRRGVSRLGLYLVDEVLDVLGGVAGLLGQSLDFVGDDCEPVSRLAGPRRLDRRVQRQHVGLFRDLVDERDDLVDLTDAGGQVLDGRRGRVDPVLEGVEDMPTESRVVGSTGYDRIAWTRADADQALEYEPEGWQFNLPTDGNGLIKLGIAAVAFAALGQAWIGSTLVGVLALPALALRPKSGSAWFAPANAHQRAAYVSMLYGAVEYEEAETLEESRRKRLESESTNQKDVEQALEKRDATLLEEAVSDVEPELANLGNGHPDHGGDTDSDDVDDQDDSGWLMDLARGVANDD